jgi:hypothetical protein
VWHASGERAFRIGGLSRRHICRVRDEVTGQFTVDSSLSSEFEAMGLLRSKHVPEMYLRAAANQRLALLQGLMDSNGYIDIYGRCEFCNINESLADAVVELAASLGLRPVKRKKRVTLNGIEQIPAFQVKFTPRFQVFRLRRKAARLKVGPAHAFRSIVDVREHEPRRFGAYKWPTPQAFS